MQKTDIAVAVYDSHEKAEAAVRELARAGFDMKSISSVGKDYHAEDQVVGYFNAGDRAKFFGKLGAFWGGLAGILFGSALMFVPIVGHIVVLGGGLSALVGALTAIGVPKDSVLRYETELKADRFLVIVHAGAGDIRRAHELLASSGSSDVQVHTPAAA